MSLLASIYAKINFENLFQIVNDGRNRVWESFKTANIVNNTAGQVVVSISTR